MSDQIPEYYRGLDLEEESAKESGRTDHRKAEKETTLCDGNGPDPNRFCTSHFELELPDEGWRDQSVYTFSGPTLDGLTHVVTLTKVEDVEGKSVTEFARDEMEKVAAELEGGAVLHKEQVELYCGLVAHRVIFVWFPEPGRRYMQQMYVHHEGSGYVLSAVFTRRSRRRLGEKVEHIMRGFDPTPEGPLH